MRLALAFMTILTVAPLRALACSCVPPPPPKTALAQAKAVFTGTVAEVFVVDEKGTRTKFDPEKDLAAYEAKMRAGHSFPKERVVVTFRVDRAWKGVDKDAAVLETGIPICCICIPKFREGESWLVYSDSIAPMSTSTCSRSIQLTHAKKDLEELGKPVAEFASMPGTVARVEIEARHAMVTKKLPATVVKSVEGVSKGKLVDACAARSSARDADDWAVTVLAPPGPGGLVADRPKIERWIVPAKGTPVALDWTSGETFGTHGGVDPVDGRFFYGELKCVKAAERATFVDGFLDGFERPEAKSVDLTVSESVCFSFDYTYNNWQCYAWSAEKKTFVRWGYQAAAD